MVLPLLLGLLALLARSPTAHAGLLTGARGLTVVTGAGAGGSVVRGAALASPSTRPSTTYGGFGQTTSSTLYSSTTVTYAAYASFPYVLVFYNPFYSFQPCFPYCATDQTRSRIYPADIESCDGYQSQQATRCVRYNFTTALNASSCATAPVEIARLYDLCLTPACNSTPADTEFATWAAATTPALNKSCNFTVADVLNAVATATSSSTDTGLLAIIIIFSILGALALALIIAVVVIRVREKREMQAALLALKERKADKALQQQQRQQQQDQGKPSGAATAPASAPSVGPASAPSVGAASAADSAANASGASIVRAG